MPVMQSIQITKIKAKAMSGIVDGYIHVLSIYCNIDFVYICSFQATNWSMEVSNMQTQGIYIWQQIYIVTGVDHIILLLLHT